MNLSELCIRRPILATMLNLVVVLVGLVSFERLTVREYPNIDVPVVTVETKYRGASAAIVESQVTKPLEDSLSGIEGIDYMSSISRAESSQITVRFRLTRDPDAAANDVRDRVGRVRDALPDDVDEPIVSKVEADAEPIIWLAVSSDRHSALEISDLADRVVQDRLQTQPGVASVLLFGGRRYAMRVNLNREAMAARNVTIQDIEAALRSQNTEIPAGRVESFEREFTVVAQTDLRTPEEFSAIFVRARDGAIVRLGDVARVELGAEDERSIARYNGQSTIALGVVKQSTANPLEVSSAIRAVLPDVQANLPAGMKVEIAYDSSIFIDQSIKNVFTTLLEACALVAAVIFLFLRSGRASIIPLVTIPVSLIGAFAIMFMLGFSINILTLLAFVLAIGLVVDDAIVVLENTFRHIEEGMTPLAAALKAMKEVSFAVIAMTLTLVAVFAPIAFTPGRTGQLFIEFALTLAGAVLVSGFIALTLTPTMCARLLKAKNAHHTAPAWSQAIERALDRLVASYRQALQVVVTIPRSIILFSVVIAGVMVGFITLLPSELSPTEDRGVIFGVVIAPEGSTLAHTDRFAWQVENTLISVPEAANRFVAVGFPVVNQGFIPLLLQSWEERSRNTSALIGELFPRLMGITGVLAFPVNPPSLGQSPTSQPIEIVLQTTGTYEELEQQVQAFMVAAAQNPTIVNLDPDLKLNKPELSITVDRAKLADLGIDVAVVGRTLETALGGREVTRFKRGGEQYEVIVQLQESDRRTPNDLSRLHVRAQDGSMVPLSNLITVEETVAPRELNHFNKLRAATISGNIIPGTPLGEALAFLEKTARETTPNLLVDFGGVSREFKESQANMLLLFGLAVAFIFMVLAAQFESYRDPLLILFSVPLAMTGALLALTLTGGTLNVYSQIGLVTLIGLITKNGIMLVEFANQLQEQGQRKIDAIINAASIRLRPILMTTAATILGALPLAIASGAGAEARQQIGWVIVGGMSLGTLLTLFVIPVFYAVFARQHVAEKTTTQHAA